MSPLLFTVYIDELLIRLRSSRYGCYVGNVFCGSLGYADDVVLLAPTVASMQAMLSICHDYASEYDVIFNPDTTKFIMCNTVCDMPEPEILFMGKVIASVPWDKHLGFPVGQISAAQLMEDNVRDFASKVNMVKCHFRHLPVDIMYFMFKTYCMPLYGCPLWDFSNKHMNKFYVAWRKSVRFLLNLPYTTHCTMLPLICNDMPVNDQLYQRFVRFFTSLVASKNIITRLCSKLALHGSGSNVGKNISVVCKHQGISRMSICNNYVAQGYNDQYVKDASRVVSELLDLKHLYRFMSNDQFLLNLSECNELIELLCTD